MLIALSGVTTLFVQRVYAESGLTSADSALVMSLSTGETVYSLHEDRKLPLGGLTNLMTALTVVDQMHDSSEYDNAVIVTKEIASYGSDFKKGDKVTVRDLLYALLIGNSEEAAHALSLYTCSSENKFVAAMNAKAQELGMKNTVFITVSEDDPAGQYSTVADLSTLVRAALNEPMIRRILTAESWTTSGKSTRSVTFRNADKLTYRGGEFVHRYARTLKKGTCSGIAVARRDGMEMLAIVLKEPNRSFLADAKSMLDYGFRHVTKNSVFAADRRVGIIKIRHGAKTILPVYTKYKGYAYVPAEGSDSLIQTKKVIYRHLTAPIKAGTKAGEYRIYVAGELTGTVDLIVKKDVKTGWLPSRIYISNAATVIICLLAAAFILLRLRIRSIRRKKRRMAARRRQKRIREMAMRQYEIDEDRRRRHWTYH